MANGERLPRATVLARPLLLLAAAIVVTEVYLAETPHLSEYPSLAAALLVPLAYFGLFLVFARWEGRRLSELGFLVPRPFLTSLAFALFLVVIASVLLLEPGFGYGFVRTAEPAPLYFGYALLLAPVTALGGEALFRGYVFNRLLAPRQFAAALGISSAGFAVVSTNFAILPQLTRVELGTYLLTTPTTTFVFGIVLGFYFYRSGRSLFGPFVLRTGLLLAGVLVPIVAFTGGWLITFLDDVVTYGALLVLVFLVLHEPRTVARRYLGETFGPRKDRFLGTLRRRHTLREAGIGIAAVAVVIVVTAVGVETGLGTTHPFLAIETGSMVPTLYRGYLVVIEHVPASQITVGTIVAYTTTCLPSPVVHRVVSITVTPNGTVYRTKGDANPSEDVCPVPYSHVLGKVVAIVPDVGFFVLSPALTVGTVFAVVLVGMLISPGAGGRFPRRRGWRRRSAP